MYRNVCTLLVLVVGMFTLQSAVLAQGAQNSRGGPPPASFIYAGPVGGTTTASGEEAIRFRFAAIIHSLAPTRIQVVDGRSGEVLVDDGAPKLVRTALKHPVDPSIPVFQWEMFSGPEAVTGNSPAWLYEQGPTNRVFEIRVYSGETLSFSFSQPASFSAASKRMFIEAAELNRKNFSTQK